MVGDVGSSFVGIDQTNPTINQGNLLINLKPRGERDSATEVIRRLSGRRTCVKAGHVYHVEFDPPKREGVCDQDGSRLEQRKDDEPETIKERLAEYHELTEPLIAWYEERGLLRRFDGTRTQDEVHSRIRATLATLALEAEI